MTRSCLQTHLMLMVLLLRVKLWSISSSQEVVTPLPLMLQCHIRLFNVMKVKPAPIELILCTTIYLKNTLGWQVRKEALTSEVTVRSSKPLD